MISRASESLRSSDAVEELPPNAPIQRRADVAASDQAGMAAGAPSVVRAVLVEGRWCQVLEADLRAYWCV